MRRDTQRLPILGDIPVLGNLFKSTHDEKTKNELVVFLTPHIIGGDKSMIDFDKKKTKSLKGYDEVTGS